METALILYTQADNTPYLVDLYENENISLNYSFNDIKDLTPRGNYSRTFRIPFTETNAKIFGFVQENTFQFSGFNPKRKINASITVDTIPIIDGYVQFKAAYTSNGEVSDLEIVFFGNVVDFFKTIGDADFKNYIASELQNNFDLIVSYDTINDFNFTNVIYLGLTDRGQNWVMNVADSGTRNIMSDFASVVPKVGELTPFVSARYIFEKIFALSGFQFNYDESNTLDEQLLKMWIPWCGESNIIAQDGNPDTARFEIRNSSNITLTDSDFVETNLSDGNTVLIADLPTLDILVDPGANIGANNTYTTPFSGSFTIAGSITLQVDEQTRKLILAFLYDDGVNQYILPNQGYIYLETYDEFTASWIYTTNVDVNTSSGASSSFFQQGITVKPIIYAELDAFVGTSIFGTPTTITISNVSMLSLEISKPLYGNVIDWSANAPVMKCSEFMSSLFKMFNLVVIADDVNPKLLSFIPIQEYLAQGNTKDWSNKIDLSKDITLTSTADSQAQENTWTYKSMNDYYNQIYNAQGNRVYGRLLLVDPENDFATKEKKTELMFGATPLNTIKGSQLPIPKFQTANSQYAAPGPRILYKTDDQITFKIFNDTISGYVLITLNLFSHYTTVIPSIADEDLNFGQETPLHYVNTTPWKTLYARYWNDYIADIYAPDARILEGFFALDFADIYQFKFNDQIFIKDSYWRILEISDYVVGMQDTVKVKLIKMVSATPDCLLRPKPVIGIDGNIIWEDAEGETQPGTEICCSNYGYYWVGSECYPSPRDSKGIGGRDKIFTEITTDLSNRQTVPTKDAAYIAPNNIVLDSNTRTFVNGDSNFVGGGNDGSIVSGRNNVVESGQGSLFVIGDSSRVINAGISIGGGGNYAGQYQSGIIQLNGFGTWTNSTTAINLLSNRSAITMPDNSVWYIKLMIVASHADGTGIDFGVTAEFNFNIQNSGGISLKNVTLVDTYSAGITGDMEVDMNISGSTFNPIVYLKNSSYPIPDVNITAQLIYTQYHYE
jgi:hypothetical protein